MIQQKDNIKKIIEDITTSDHGPGCAVGLYLDGEEAFICRGKASIENHLDITRDTKFHIASITKQFTATIFRILEKQGLVNEDDALSQYFDIDMEEGEQIKLKHLLSHTNGIRDQWELTYFAGWQDHDPITNQAILTLLKRQAALNFQPGKFYAYCNTGYTLLGLLMEKVSGKKINDLLGEYVLEPCNLTATLYYHYNDVISDFASAYKKDGDVYRISKPNFDVIGSTSMYSTVSDLIRFERYHYEHAREDQAVRGDNFSRQPFYKDGMIHAVLNGQPVELHSGWDYGYSSFLLRVPNRKMSVAILSNTGNPLLFKQALGIAALFCDEIKIWTQHGTVAEHDLKSGHQKIKEGYYLHFPSNVIHEIKENKGQLTMEGNRLIAADSRFYSIENSLNEVKPTSDSSFHYSVLGYDFHFDCIDNAAYNLSLEYGGEYYSHELDVTYYLTNDRGHLVVQGPKFKQWRLVTITDQLFKCDRFTLRLLTTEGKVTGFTISNLRAWNIVFTKANGS